MIFTTGALGFKTILAIAASTAAGLSATRAGFGVTGVLTAFTEGAFAATTGGVVASLTTGAAAGFELDTFGGDITDLAAVTAVDACFFGCWIAGGVLAAAPTVTVGLTVTATAFAAATATGETAVGAIVFGFGLVVGTVVAVAVFVGVAVFADTVTV
jgi:hypothetical protein